MSARRRRPHTPPSSPSLVVLIDFPTVFDTIDHEKLFGMLDRLPRLGPRTKRWLNNSLQDRHVRVCAREQHSRKRLTSAGGPQGSVPGPQLSLYCADDLLRRLCSIYSASAFMHADEHTLVASGAGIHACAAAMRPALSLITAWAAEHCLKINVAKSEAALFCNSPHRRSDEDTADHRLGGGKPCVKSHSARLPGNGVDRHLNFGVHATAAARQIVPRRHQPRLTAEAGASHHTMRPKRVAYVHGALFHDGGAIFPYLAPACRRIAEARYRESSKASLGPSTHRENTSVHLESNLLPLRRILWLRAITQRKRYTRLHDHGDLRCLTHSEPMSPSMHGKAATSTPPPRDAVINGLLRVCNIIGIPHNHNRAPPIQHRIFL
ncbi:hypothetical protein TcBrA4_0017710 [Trypanosoma cruzi]|nr:hypothetical protein TcBrA4_0017710 [Trypanosoma cruzi]